MKAKLTSFFIILLLTTHGLSQNAPVTNAARVIDAVPGDPAVPVAISVTGFNNIGQFTLTMKFDTTRLHYNSAITNPLLPGMTVTFIAPSGNNQAKLVFSWSDTANVSLMDGSDLANLTFMYKTGTGILAWSYTFGAVCQYKSYISSNLSVLNDSPKNNYYLNGGISNRTAPVTNAPFIADPLPGALPVAISVDGFTNIASFTLYLEYDPAIIVYQNTFTKNPVFDANFQVGDMAGFGGKRLIMMQWYGVATGLANGSTLCTLNFNYAAASCNASVLGWYDSGPSCQYADGSADVLIDMPQADYYWNGIVASGLPSTWTGNNSSAWDNAGNWDGCGIPNTTRNAVIPNVSPNPFPVIDGLVSCKSVAVQPGATLIIAPAGVLVIGE